MGNVSLLFHSSFGLTHPSTKLTTFIFLTSQQKKKGGNVSVSALITDIDLLNYYYSLSYSRWHEDRLHETVRRWYLNDCELLSFRSNWLYDILNQRHSPLALDTIPPIQIQSKAKAVVTACFIAIFSSFFYSYRRVSNIFHAVLLYGALCLLQGHNKSKKSISPLPSNSIRSEAKAILWQQD